MPPDLKHLKSCAANGVSFQLPSNWVVTWSGRLEDTDRQGVGIEADKTAFEALTLSVTVQAVRAKGASTLKGRRLISTTSKSMASLRGTRRRIAPIMLNGKCPMLLSRHLYMIFRDDRIYACWLDLRASLVVTVGSASFSRRVWQPMKVPRSRA